VKKPLVNAAAVAVLVLLVGWLGLVSAGADPDKKPPGNDPKGGKADAPSASRFHAHVRPNRPGSSSVPVALPDGREHSILLDLPSETDEKAFPGLRFHRPVFALVERDTPVEPGLPPVIDYVRRNPNGSADVRFRVMVTNPDFKKRCRDVVAEKERPLLAAKGLTPDDIDIEPWPLLHCVVCAKDGLSDEVLGVAQTGTLSRTRSDFDFTFNLSAAELDRLTGLIRKGELQFVYSYRYSNTIDEMAKADLTGVNNATVLATEKLQSMQKRPDDPIFQGEANEATRYVYLSVHKRVRATNQALIPLLDQTKLYQKLFAPDGAITLAELKQGDERKAAMIAAYLKPHLERVRESLGEDKKYVTINDERRGTSVTTTPPTISAGIAVPLGPVIPSISISKSLGDPVTKTDEFLKRVEQATGSTWAKDKDSETYRPHSVNTVKLLSGKDQVLVDESVAAYVSVGENTGYLEDSPVPVTLTTKTAKLAAMVDGLGPYQGVPLGVPLPYFGATLPKGYVWADGTTTWPNAKWVPEHLRGAKVPDMREHLIGGAKDEKEVGMVFNKGQLVVEGQTIQGNKFKTPAASKLVPQTSEPQDVPFGELKFVAVHRRANPQHGKRWDGWDGSLYTDSPGYILAVKGEEALTGEHPVEKRTLTLNTAASNPRHVMCRWIIRVD
jgi:uncharacterized protein YukE